MTRTPAQSPTSAAALVLVETLQARFVTGLQVKSAAAGAADRFEPVEWFRGDGRHGGGTRFEIGDTAVFNRGSVNVSQVHYDDDPSKRLSSATALSTIIHPAHPRAPSVHMHYSWTEMRDGGGYWRMMADLNPSIPVEADEAAFVAALRVAAGDHLESGLAQGDRYFYIPALGRHRGVAHFYLEGHRTEDVDADAALARRIGETMIDAYVEILGAALARAEPPTADDCAAQLAYHTVYLLQVLTLDRGTTSGLLVHDQNDVGIMGSLPSHVDRSRLASWEPKMTPPQDELLRALVHALHEASPSPVTLEAKRALAQAVRTHYRAHPEALAMQASGDVIPPTVDNHR